MNPFTSSLILLVNVFFNLLAIIVLLRFLMQLVRADFYNPVSQAIAKITNPVLVPLRRVIPGFGGFDIASLVLLFLVMMLATFVLGLLHGGIVPLLYLALWAPLGIVSLFLKFYLFAIVISVVLSWVAPGNPSPVIYLLHQLIEPVMGPFRRIIPPLGPVDITPMIVMLAILIAQEFVRYAASGVRLNPNLVVGF
jgi:YggT family protein